MLAALSRAVGTPAFSISKLIFVFVEGEVGERERYDRLSGSPQNIRFMESGSCNEVWRRVEAIKTLAKEASAEIHIGGVIDRDFRTDSEAKSIEGEHGVFVLPVHEGENFFIHPATLTVLLQQNGRTTGSAIDLIRDAADERAGSWIFQYAMQTPNAAKFSGIELAAKDRATTQNWRQIDTDRNASLQSIVNVSGFGPEDKVLLGKLLNIGAEAYSKKRLTDDLWKVCEGKQVLNDVARARSKTPIFGAPLFATSYRFKREGGCNGDFATIDQQLRGFRVADEPGVDGDKHV